MESNNSIHVKWYGVSSFDSTYHHIMSIESYRKNAVDEAAREILTGFMVESGLSSRDIASGLQGPSVVEEFMVHVTHTRILNLQKGKTNPVKLSEMIAICEFYHKDPVDTMRKIIARAHEIADQRRAIQEAEKLETEVDDIVQRLHEGASPSELGLAANTDQNKEAESETPYE